MAKKKSHKKHQFKHSTPAVSSGSRVVEPAVVSVQASKTVASAASYEVASLNLIKQDVRKVAVLATSFVALQAILWFLFNHTGLGNTVYHLIKL